MILKVNKHGFYLEREWGQGVHCPVSEMRCGSHCSMFEFENINNFEYYKKERDGVKIIVSLRCRCRGPRPEGGSQQVICRLKKEVLK